MERCNSILEWRAGGQGNRTEGLLYNICGGPGRGSFSTGFTGPAGLAVDSAGNLYVADTGNSRILRFPKPFSQSDQILPDLVIGQSDFSTGGPTKAVSLLEAWR
ncbi:MAG: hypothetical protein DMG57_16635 [Acidobacteria bacterium]|nr:MAG: hypothetical protein DMG57_16635 [Acidobacteriota bacterium]